MTRFKDTRHYYYLRKYTRYESVKLEKMGILVLPKIKISFYCDTEKF